MITQNIQFPWRFLGMASLFLAVVASCLYILLKRKEGTEVLNSVSVLILALSVLSGGYFMGDFVQKADQGFYSDETSMNSCDTMLGEYLPAGTNSDMFADVSFLYYRGYQAVDQVSGERLDVTGSGENKVRVMIPTGYEGIFRVQFVSPWYWRAGEMVSFVTLVGIIVILYLKKKGQNGKTDSFPGGK